MNTAVNPTALVFILGFLVVSLACGACSSGQHQDQCEPGYVGVTRNDPGMYGAPMTFCIAGPDHCKTTSDCRPDYACERNGGTLVSQGSGVCLPDTVAVLQRIE